MKTIFWGLGLSLGYGLGAAAIVSVAESPTDATQFLIAYIRTYNASISFGLILATVWIVFRTQTSMPAIIENAFQPSELPKAYYRFRFRFLNAARSIVFVGVHIVIAWAIFSVCQFPLYGLSELLMLACVCAQYGLGVYVGRKLFYAGMMLHSLLEAKVTRNLFKDRQLDAINTYVHIASTLTIIFVYVHVRGYYPGQYEFRTIFGDSARVFLLLPALIATPVLLIFNFYPRAVLRRIYGQSIDVELQALRDKLTNEKLSEHEKRSYLVSFDKMCRDELRYSLQLTLSDLPIGVTILVMILEPLIKR